MFRSSFRLALASLVVLSLVPSSALADPTNEFCDPDKSLSKSCPKSFRIVELPDSTATQALAVDEPFLLYTECVAGKGGVSCGGWPRETGEGGNLSYEWSFEGKEAKLVFPSGNAATRNIDCAVGDRIVATLTVSNGSYRATSSQSFVCGASI